MTRGALLFAFNTPKKNYFKMAEYTAKRINFFLNLPVTIVTDISSYDETTDFNFDKVILISPNTSNKKSDDLWINKGRFQAFELSPYEETLVIDVDYVVNSDRLLKIFECYDDFCCHDSTMFLMQNNLPQSYLSEHGLKLLWATVICFKKTQRARQIFECMEMVQNNYDHYSCLHGFAGKIYRNDFALTIALHLVNGHCLPREDIIPWNLVHIGENTHVYKENSQVLDTSFTILFDNWQKGKIRKEYITIKDMDFHLLNKDNFTEFLE